MSYLVWCILACLALVALPVALRQGIPFWSLPTDQLLPVFISAIAYLAFPLVLFIAVRVCDGLGIFQALVLGGACFVLVTGILFLRPEMEFSRLALLVTGVLGILLAVYPMLVNRKSFLLAYIPLCLLLLIAGGVVLMKQHSGESASPHGRSIPERAAIPEGASQPKRLPATTSLYSSLYMLDRMTYADIPVQPKVDGGAIDRFNDGFIAVTGDGQFYQLDWDPADGRLNFTRLPLASPLVGRDAFFARAENAGLRFRVTDLSVRASSDGGYEVFVSHQVWDQGENCFRMGLSRARLPAPTETATESQDAWTTVYQTHPCMVHPFDSVETGGRLAWLGPDKLLMTVGDHGFDGVHHAEVSQSPDSDYGKVLLLDMHGGAQVFSSGHRNPQGLLIDTTGQVWSTEHGPAGGDELNLLVAGNNYGWPLATYGTDYDKFTWPLSPEARDHGAFTEPVYAFVPSITISNLIQLGGQQFPRWEGDFLVGSLKMRTLYRVRIHDDRVIYVEPIFLGRRIRDLVEGADGRVLVWSDDASVTVVSQHLAAGAEEYAFLKCRRCHLPAGNASAIAPSLEGVFGRKIASSPDFSYSPALRAVEGVWTEERLQAFLADPQAFAPGTLMGNNGVPDKAVRAALVDFLKTYGAGSP